MYYTEQHNSGNTYATDPSLYNYISSLTKSLSTRLRQRRHTPLDVRPTARAMKKRRHGSSLPSHLASVSTENDVRGESRPAARPPNLNYSSTGGRSRQREKLHTHKHLYLRPYSRQSIKSRPYTHGPTALRLLPSTKKRQNKKERKQQAGALNSSDFLLWSVIFRLRYASLAVFPRARGQRRRVSRHANVEKERHANKRYV